MFHQTPKLKPKEILTANVLDVSFDHGISFQEAEKFLATKRKGLLGRKRKLDPSGLDTFQRKRLRHVSTNIQELDQRLEGGVELGSVTEFIGFPGTGKSQFCFQLCVNVSVPNNFNGLASEAMYIDTQSNFNCGRLHQIAQATASMIQRKDPDACITTQKILESIYVYHVSSRKELSRLINLIPALCQRFPKIRLVVIDSIVFHLRHDYEENQLKDRARIVADLGKSLKRHAATLNIAIVTTNQMTSKKKESGRMEPEPSLGRAWSDYVDIRLLLYLDGNDLRRITFLKSEKLREDDQTHIDFNIRTLGVRGIPKQMRRA